MTDIQFKPGDTYLQPGDDHWRSGIHVDDHGNAIEVFQPTKEGAEALRDKVMDALTGGDWSRSAAYHTLRPLQSLFAPERSEAGIGSPHACWMLSEIAEGRVTGRKAHRWLGYAQGLLVSYGMMTLDQAKRINHQASGEPSNA